MEVDIGNHTDLKSDRTLELLVNVELLSSKSCQLLKSGFNTERNKYYFCSCDPDQREPMCLDCYNNCHREHMKKDIISVDLNAICHCGLNYHKIITYKNQNDSLLRGKCMFMEWSKFSNANIYYTHNLTNNKFCMFCANYCEENVSFSKVSESTNDECSCEGEAHKDIKLTMKKITQMFCTSNKAETQVINFENMTPIHFFNMLQLSKESFKNSFGNMMEYITSLKDGINNENTYVIDNNIGYSAAMKSLETLSKLSSSIKHLYYLESETEFIDIFSNNKFIFPILEKKFDYKTAMNVWILKNYLLNMYINFVIKKDFESIHIFSIKDLENLHPFQRIMYTRMLKSDEKINSIYFSNLQFDHLESILNVIERFNGIKEKSLMFYELMSKLYEICLLYASVNHFKKEHIMRFCTINDATIINTEILDMLKTPHPNTISILESQLKIMNSMIKTNLYLVYCINDTIIENLLNNNTLNLQDEAFQVKLNNLHFFHSASEEGKFINKNCISIFNYIRNCKRVIDDAKFNNKPSLKNLSDVSDQVEKYIRKVISYGTEITSMTINYPDNYLIGLRKLIEKNTEIYLNYIQKDDTMLSDKEKKFIDQIKKLNERIQEIYFGYFNFKFKLDDLNVKITSFIQIFFNEIVGLPDYQIPYNPLYNSNIEEGNKKKVKKDLSEMIVDSFILTPGRDKNKLTSLFKRASTIVRSGSNISEEMKIKFKILLNKSMLIFTVIKSIKINANTKSLVNSLSKDKLKSGFIIDDSLLDQILRLLYFYVENNHDNCVIVMTADILDIFLSLHKSQLFKFTDFLNYVLLTIFKNNIMMVSNTNLTKIIKNLVTKLSGDPECIQILDSTIKIIRTFLQIQFINQEHLTNKLRKIIRHMYKLNPILTEFKNFLIKEEDLSNLLEHNSTKIYRDLKQELSAILSGNLKSRKSNNEIKDDNNSGTIIVDKKDEEKLKFPIDLSSSELKNKNDDSLTPKNGKDMDGHGLFLSGYSVSSLVQLYIDFLQVVNSLFEGTNTTTKDQNFLSEIISCTEFPKILRKTDLELNLRNEILKFFRISTIDIVISSDKLTEYRSKFVSPIKLPEECGLLSLEDRDRYYFFRNLIETNHDPNLIIIEASVIRYELKHFEIILEKSKCTEADVILDFFHDGIMLSLIYFLDKFMSIIYTRKGYDYLMLYEIVFYFLQLKKFLIENKTKLNAPVTFEFKKIFKTYLMKNDNNLKLIFKELGELNLSEVNKDINEMKSETFEILNYENVFRIFEKHIKGFLDKPKINSLKKLFEKKDHNYAKDKLQKLKKLFLQKGFLQTNLEKVIFNVIIKYENDKNKLSESSFIQNLGEQNIRLDSNYRAIILKTVFYLVNDDKLSEKYRTQNFGYLFKLLQQDTVPTQQEILLLYKENKSNIQFHNIANLFLYNFLSIIFSSCKGTTNVFNHNYYISVVIIKIFKYMCEEHNRHFQTIFFEELKFDYVLAESASAEGEDKMQIQSNSHINASHLNAHVVEHKSPNMISLFDLLLGILGKIIVLSKWEKVQFEHDEKSISYFYDLFFVIIELLIEMVQGTTCENLQVVVAGTEITQFILFLNNAKKLLFRDENDSKIVYKVRNDIINLIAAFVEEKESPRKLINTISSIYTPYIVFETIVNSLKKLYNKQVYPSNKEKVKNYQLDIFDHKKCQFFINSYFNNPEFSKSAEFEFANRLYQYVKLLAAKFKCEDAINIIQSINNHKEEKIIGFYSLTKNDKKGEASMGENEVILDDTYVENYFAVKFFEHITRSVTVIQDNSEVLVLFTLNPLIPYLSKNTKLDFYTNVDRESRYIKLFSLMEFCDYFYDEIIYNSKRLKSNPLLRILDKINFFYCEVILFIPTIAFNLILLISLDKKELEEDVNHNKLPNIFTPIQILAFIHIVLNFILIIIWFITKFSLYYIIEKKKYSLENKIKIENLSFFQKLSIMFYHSILLRNEINVLVWNVILGVLGSLSPINTFLFSIQMLSVINLSQTLKNIIRSVTMRHKQLLAAAMFIVIMIYVFTNFAFFFFNYDFIITIGGPAHHRLLSASASSSDSHGSDNPLAKPDGGTQENRCGTFFYCFLTHLDLGLRTDGGVAEHLKKITYDKNAGYFIGRFFYETGFFIVIVVILLSIVFGIIIDTFAELREDYHHIEMDKINKCFICGAKREDLEKNCVNYSDHVTREHDIWTYAEYIIGLKFLDPQETNAVNSYVISMVEQKSISWFPSSNVTSEEEEHH